ncbi:MAG: MotA/TolQ/ExbB proton channel family protein [Myxococcales bacterium]|nr:MotA/TolQ/ExbB proton channel family protein [Myxococcales bacterium]MDH5566827.1 MotA/TolQ/ExbB proton channel family protein [Myxococcales bacterium]
MQSKIRGFVALGIAVTALGWSAQAQQAATKTSESSAEAAAPVVPAQPQATSLDQLLGLVRAEWKDESKESKEREARFLRAKEEQAKLLADARALKGKLEDRSEQLEGVFEGNERTLAELTNTLAERMGTLGELFGVVRQVAGDARGNLESSLVSAQLAGDRVEFLEGLGKSKALPAIADLERLWYELQREMTEQGKVVRFQASVLNLDGAEETREVVRAGPFTAVSNDRYVLWEIDAAGAGKLRDLTKQPPARYVNTVGDFERAKSGIVSLAVDPSRGSLLSLLIQTPNRWERIQQGKSVGYVTIVLGIIALIIGVVRWFVVTITGRKVAAQRKASTPDRGNPLGRVLSVYAENRNADAETLELKLDEAVMRETVRIERFLWLVKVVSVVAPLLGLLGTVTGMIQTFQAITLFGAGDPKMMASGIAEALVTTMIGLMVAIPLVLLHALVSNGTKGIVDILDEQSAGLIATQAENAGAGA